MCCSNTDSGDNVPADSEGERASFTTNTALSNNPSDRDINHNLYLLLGATEKRIVFSSKHFYRVLRLKFRKHNGSLALSTQGGRMIKIARSV